MRFFPPQLRRSSAMIAAVLTLASAVACGGDGGTDPGSDAIEGTYSLKTHGGVPLPITIGDGTTTYTLASDVITIVRDGSWSEAFTQTATTNGQTTSSTDVQGGTWARAGSSVTLYSSVANDTAHAGTYRNGTLTFSDLGIVSVFVRQ
jgi:hypothetical protein